MANGIDRALTGTGRSGYWAGSTKLTSHTGTSAGAHDLNGNVHEWTQNLGAAITTGNYTLFDPGKGSLDLGFHAGRGQIRGLSTDPRWRRFGVPAETTNGPRDAFGFDYLWKDETKAGKSFRGGGFNDGGGSGVWALGVYRVDGGPSIGFRPALVFTD